jgi:hypothetical protein
MRFLCEFLRVKLVTLDVHGGTTPDDVAMKFAEAASLCGGGDSGAACAEVWVFLDEVNTSTEIGLLTEAITKRSLNGSPIHPNIQVLGAVNPYRKRPPRREDAGFGLNQHAHGAVAGRYAGLQPSLLP